MTNPIKLPAVHVPHVTVPAGLIVVIVAVVVVALAAGVWLAVRTAKRTDPIDKLCVRRHWDWRGVRSYRGVSKNPQVPAGFSLVAGRPVRRGMLGGSRLDRRPVGAGQENCALLMGGPRVGKSTSYVIPAIAAALGPVVATSNKPDIVEATRLLREEKGRAWVFDPQQVFSSEAPAWWWNPLRRVTNVQTATELAQIWIDTSKESNAVPDAYFETAGTQLLAGLIFAAALAAKPASAVFWWLTDPNRAQEAIEILHPTAAYGGYADRPLAELEGAARFEATAEAVASVLRMPDKQRGGVFGTAMKAVDWMQSPELRQWIEDPEGRRPEFLPVPFATSHDTLYSLSKEGSNILRPLITALTADVLLSADQVATTMPGGRLEIPMFGALDECGNVCPWRQLPAMFSFFGSRGIPLFAVFQSPAQMRMTFGAEPAQALLSAANLRITMGGVDDRAHYDNLEKLFGTVKVKDVTRHKGQGKGSSTTAWREQTALNVGQMASMRHNRAALTLSACSPMLIQPRPWWEDKTLAPRIKASRARYGARTETGLAMPAEAVIVA